MSTTTLSSKGQVSLPVDMQRRFGWKAGDKFIVTYLDGSVILHHLPKGDFLAMAGKAKLPPGYTRITDDEIEEAAMAAALARDEKSRRRD